MSQERRYYRSEYISGNAVRQTRPQLERPSREHHRRRQTEQEILRNQKALSMNGTSVFFLGIVSLVCILMCVIYLNIQSGISESRTNISKLKTQINTVQSQNDALNYSINSHMDTGYIYKTAKNDLGMKQAGEDQIVTYHASDSGYMVQYGEIPSK